jgi:hypothetical protein
VAQSGTRGAIRLALALTVLAVTLGLIVAPPVGAAGSQEQPKTIIRRGLAPRIGSYHLDMKTSDGGPLVELTSIEKQALNASIQFKGERIYHAQSANFAGVGWDIVLGAVDDRVYKISALLIVHNREQLDATWRNVDSLLRPPLGSPESVTPSMVAWDTEDGNVVMNRTETAGAYAFVLTLTSRAVTTFTRIR